MRGFSTNLFLQLAYAVCLETVKSGGCSLNGSFDPATTGYMVSVEKSKEIQFKDTMSVCAHRVAALAELGLTKHNGAYLGGWKDEATGVYYFDISVNVPTLAKAKELAKRHSQKAIYEVESDTVITL